MPTIASGTVGVMLPTTITPTNFCNGPIGLPVVMATTNPDSPYAISICDGANMYNLWMWNNQIVQATHVGSGYPNCNSWLAINQTAPQPVYWTGTTPTPNIFNPWGTPEIRQLIGTVFTPPKPRPRLVPAVIRAGRRALRRSIDLYARFRGMDEIRRFVNGEAIDFQGHLYDYRVQKSIKLLGHTMQPTSRNIPYSLKLVEKFTGKVLATGCIVFPDLPVIDQLLSFVFHLEDIDDERKMLKTTNWAPRVRLQLTEPQADLPLQLAA